MTLKLPRPAVRRDRTCRHARVPKRQAGPIQNTQTSYRRERYRVSRRAPSTIRAVHCIAGTYTVSVSPTASPILRSVNWLGVMEIGVTGHQCDVPRIFASLYPEAGAPTLPSLSRFISRRQLIPNQTSIMITTSKPPGSAPQIEPRTHAYRSISWGLPRNPKMLS